MKFKFNPDMKDSINTSDNLNTYPKISFVIPSKLYFASSGSKKSRCHFQLRKHL